VLARHASGTADIFNRFGRDWDALGSVFALIAIALLA